MSDHGIVDMFGVAQERKDHPAIKSARKEDQHVDGAIGFRRVDGQRLFKGPGTAGMGATTRFKNTGGARLNTSSPGSFKMRKRTLKG